MTKEDRLSRLGPLSGVLFVALQLGGVAIGSQPMATLGDPSSKILDTIATHPGTAAWVGAYMEVGSLAAFAVFAAWLFQSRRGPLATAGLLAAGVYVAISLAGLVVGDVIKYGAGHGMGDHELLALFYLQSGLFFASWGIAAAFLALVPLTGWLRRSAVVIAGLLLVAMAAPTADPAQFPNMLFLIWSVVAGISLARRPHTVATPAPAVQAAVRP